MEKVSLSRECQEFLIAARFLFCGRVPLRHSSYLETAFFIKKMKIVETREASSPRRSLFTFDRVFHLNVGFVRKFGDIFSICQLNLRKFSQSPDGLRQFSGLIDVL